MSSGLFTTAFHLVRSSNKRHTKLVMREVVVSFPPTKICTNIESISASVSGSSCDIAACVNSEIRSFGNSLPCAMRSRRIFTSLMRYSLIARRAAISRSGSTMFMPCSCASLHSLNVSRISSGTPSMRAMTITGRGIASKSCRSALLPACEPMTLTNSSTKATIIGSSAIAARGVKEVLTRRRNFV